ncbi:MAG: sensor histidine kinase, partial [Burkholderiales bacterium]|nr:sensor histidine kinase [Burkholderiales bacterium]
CLSASAPASVIRWEGRAVPAGGGSPRWVQVGASASEQDLMGTVWAGMMTDITEQKLTEAQLARSRDELRAQSAHAARARESERARIAREIHDEIGGTLTGLRADLVWLKRRLGGDEAIREKLEYMDELVDTAASTSVRLVRDLRPAVLDFGFVSALQWLARDFRKHAGIACAFVCNVEETELDRERATAIFRIFQELLTNVTKHARASAVAARLEVGESDVVLEVRDDGIGIVIPSRRRNDAYGIRGMRERAQELGGTLEINSGEHGGTVAVMRAPRHAPA